jgi:hypothetical protein
MNKESTMYLHAHICTQWNTTQPNSEENLAISHNIVEPGRHYATCNIPDTLR